MKTCCICKQLFPLSSFHKDKTNPDGHSYSCKSCKNKTIKANYDSDKMKAKAKARRANESPEQRENRLLKARERRRASYYADHENEKLKQAAYREQNKPKVKAAIDRHYQDNRADYIERSRKRRLHIANSAKPSWANDSKIKVFYEFAALMSSVTGATYSVDHIDPLKNDLVCGLHCEANLRVVSLSENCAKSNKFKPYSISF